MGAPAFGKRPDSAIAVRFFALGLVGFLARSAGVAALPAAIAVPPGAQGILLLQLAVLGWITPVMMGADHQLIPVVLHQPLVAPSLAVPIFWVFAAGATVFLGGWALDRTAWIAVGGTAAGAARLRRAAGGRAGGMAPRAGLKRVRRRCVSPHPPV